MTPNAQGLTLAVIAWRQMSISRGLGISTEGTVQADTLILLYPLPLHKNLYLLNQCSSPWHDLWLGVWVPPIEQSCSTSTCCLRHLSITLVSSSSLHKVLICLGRCWLGGGTNCIWPLGEICCRRMLLLNWRLGQGWMSSVGSVVLPRSLDRTRKARTNLLGEPDSRRGAWPASHVSRFCLWEGPQQIRLSKKPVMRLQGGRHTSREWLWHPAFDQHAVSSGGSVTARVPTVSDVPGRWHSQVISPGEDHYGLAYKTFM